MHVFSIMLPKIMSFKKQV